MPASSISPPWTSLGKEIESACRKAAYDFSLIEKEKIGVALSGGKDSLTLLFMLKAISGRGFLPFTLTAFHLSGSFSCGPSIMGNYLKKFCDEIEVELIIGEMDQKLEELECYSCSRKRRRWIFDAAKKEGIDTIAFGHHRDDNIQTGLMNLLQKGEFAGMLPKVPMIEYGVTIIRPLILVSEKQIYEFAKLHKFARISCQCPIGQNSKRKQVEKLIEEMETVFPHARSNLSHGIMEYGSKKALKP